MAFENPPTNLAGPTPSDYAVIDAYVNLAVLLVIMAVISGLILTSLRMGKPTEDGDRLDALRGGPSEDVTGAGSHNINEYQAQLKKRLEQGTRKVE